MCIDLRQICRDTVKFIKFIDHFWPIAHPNIINIKIRLLFYETKDWPFVQATQVFIFIYYEIIKYDRTQNKI